MRELSAPLFSRKGLLLLLLAFAIGTYGDAQA